MHSLNDCYFTVFKSFIKMRILCILVCCKYFTLISTYSNHLFTIKDLYYKIRDGNCGGFDNPPPVVYYNKKLKHISYWQPSTTSPVTPGLSVTFRTIGVTTVTEKDAMISFQKMLNKLLFGHKVEDDRDLKKMSSQNTGVDILAHFPSGNINRVELFLNKSAVHLPLAEFIHRGHCFLDVTNDYMQTAVNALAIFLWGNIEDILRLPSSYVLRSARTIAMMNIAREKLAATWMVVKGRRHPSTISYQTLEMYRPLFKYLNGKEMSRLNLSDERILYYLGTHADLNRHQVGVIAHRYLELNPNWKQPRYLNLMNNLICGVPMIFMRKSPENTYLQLSHQLFYHIHACDPLQRRFYLTRMTKTQTLGKSYSWSARDVSRLGLLLTEVEGPELSLINPEAMSGISAQVMLEIPASNMKYITDTQLRYLDQKSYNILARKLKTYKDEQQIFNRAGRVTLCNFLMLLIKTTL
ncbi:uncharacterized protein LOC115446985 [Manduca sexta]|nr:uncharacterized protein LOC115446985 [Manduca sexta]